ncbi:MAG: non-ribosomal peptide synthetase, partial [Blastocatellia bacterium AA13]
MSRRVKLQIQKAIMQKEISVQGYRLSPQQKHLWLMQQRDGGKVYVAQCAVLVQGGFDLERFRSAVEKIVARHEILRTDFVGVSRLNVPLQSIAEEGRWSLMQYDLSDCSSVECERRAQELFDQFAREACLAPPGSSALRVGLVSMPAAEHILFITLPAMCADSSALEVFIREISLAYDLPEEPPEEQAEWIDDSDGALLQYAEIAEWWNELLESEDMEAGREYWRKVDLSRRTSLRLPFENSRGLEAAFEPEAVYAPLHGASERVLALALRHNSSPQSVMLGAWKVLLAHLAHESEVLVGAAYENRKYAQLKGSIGLLAGYVPLCSRLNEEVSFTDLIASLDEQIAEAYEWQEYFSWDQVEETGVDEGPRFFPICFEYAEAEPCFGSNGARFSIMKKAASIDRFELKLCCTIKAESLQIALHYDAGRYERDSIELLTSRYIALLDNILNAPESAVGDLEVIAETERKLLLNEFNDTSVEYENAAPLHELFEAQVKRTPDAGALAQGDRNLSYLELNQRANRIANHLRSVGVGPEAAVGICLERSFELVEAILGVLKTGAAYVPLDPEYPAARLNYIAGDARLAALITRRSLIGDLSDSNIKIVDLDVDSRAIDPCRDHDSDSGAALDNLAYIIYTSGSTGKPKGAMNTHRGPCNLLDFTRAVYGIDAGERVLQLASVSFDFSVWEIFIALSSGAALVLTDGNSHRDGRYIVDLIAEQRITTVHFVPSMLQAVLEQEGIERCESLRRVLSGGEMLTSSIQSRFFDRLQAELHNQYGPTETSIDVSYWRCDPLSDKSTVPIGRANANNRLYVLDRDLRPAPIGVAGELFAAGRGVCRGYIGKPDLTAEKFLPDPFGNSGERFYKTGDRARYLSDGAIEYLGRLDGQIKIRGYRIEIGEIEALLAGHACVQEAAVVLRPDSRGQGRMVAYATLRIGSDISTAELRDYLRQSLPDYMVPSAIAILERMPVTVGGKLDRQALPEPERSGRSASSGAVSLPTEEVLAMIWSEVLGIEEVGFSETFFDLGGHSLLATQLISAIRATFKVDLPLRELFETPTVEGLARKINNLLFAGHKPEAPPVERAPRSQDLPLSYAQERLWFTAQMDPENWAYNIPAALHLIGELNVAALRRTVSALVRRHETLRTTFDANHGRPAQIIHAAEESGLEAEDLTALGDMERKERVDREIRTEAERPFDLEQGPLFRIRLLKLGDREHVVLLTMHHIISDGWSMGVLIREVAELYGAFHEGRESVLPELEVQYADYAMWQRTWLTGEVLERHAAYWKKHLDGAPRVSELQTDRPRPAVQTYRGARRDFTIDAAVNDGLKKVSRAEGVTLFMTLLAAWQTLLSRYSGQEDVVVGADVANRNRGETEGLIGFFVNMLVLRTDLSGDPTFSELLGRVRETTLGAYAHQDLPFEKLVEELQPERSLSHSPLFQQVIVLHNTPGGELELPELSLRALAAETETAMYDVLLSLRETGGILNASFVYNRDLFDAATIERMSRQYLKLLEGIGSAVETRLSELSLLSPIEERQLLVDWNGTATAFPADAAIASLFEAQAARTPDATAVTHGEERITYDCLNRRANKLARHLGSLGVGPEVVVGLCTDRGIEVVIGMLGILKAGGAYLPLDSQYSFERLTLMLEDSMAPVIVTQERLVDRLPGHWAHLLCLDSDAEAIERESDENPAPSAAPDNIAYIMYTSGSTGEPKGVTVVNRGVVRLVKNTDYASFDSRDVILQLAPHTFDASTLEFWAALLNGGCLALMPEPKPSLAEISDAISRYGVTTMWLTAGLFHLMVDQHIESLTRVKQLLAGGDVLSVGHVEKLLSAGHGGVLINGYGPTENTTFTCCHRMTGDISIVKTVPIGRPIANTQVYILDGRCQPAVPGAIGELLTGGEGLSRGYNRQPAQTAERFVPDPFSADGGERLYRTGDLAKYLADGNVEFLGRRDRQVKIRGFRIELEEIEAALEKHPGIRTAVATVRDEGTGKRIAAYVVFEEGKAASISELRQFLTERLPDYMIPGWFVALDELPLTANGKIARDRLPAPDQADVEADRYAAPRTPVEELLSGIWSEVLGLERVGVLDDFFELGGHSLLATQVVSRIREAFGVELPLRDLFERPVIRELAKRVELGLWREEYTAAPPIKRADRRDASPLSFAQQRLWFIDKLEPGSLYNINLAVRLQGSLDTGAVDKSISEIVRRHESLRTVFGLLDQEPIQIVRDAEEITIPIEDLTGLDSINNQVLRRAVEEASFGFDLENGPLFRVRLLKLGVFEHVLLLSMHHIVSDAWSLGILIKEFAALYQSYSARKDSPLPELEIQYSDFAAWQRDWLRGDVLNGELSYWKEQLSDAPGTLELPTDFPRPAVLSHRGARAETVIEPLTLERLNALARKEGATLFMVLLAAWQALLARCTQQEDIAVGTPVANRNRIETEPLIGFFVNTLVLRTRMSADPSFRALLGRVKDVTLGAFAHQDLPFEKLVEELAPNRTLGQTPLFQVMFSVQNAPIGSLDLEGLQISSIETDATAAKFDLSLDIHEVDSGLLATLDYETDLFDPATIIRLSEQFAIILRAIVDEPALRLSELPLLSEQERKQVLIEWNDTARSYPTELCVHQLFETRVNESPDATAIVFEEEHVSYRELNLRSNRLAHYLRGRGVGEEMTVGICLPRSVHMLTSVLGVLKSGGAYVPLDPANPAERLAVILRDANPKVLLTDKSLASTLADSSCEIVCVDTAESLIAQESDENPDSPAAPENAAYIIYTSGSTGKPKGVVVPHRSVVNRNFAMAERYGLGASDRVLAFTNLSFDVSIEEMFPSWMNGATVVLRSANALDSALTFLNLLDRERITVVNLPNSYFNEVVTELANQPIALALRVATVGGEKGSRALFESGQTVLGDDVTLFNGYGPTETTVTSATYLFRTEHRPAKAASVPIGQPVANSQAYVFDRWMQAVPAGVTGEMYIGGEGLARGYLNHPELTAEKFLPDAIRAIGGARLYATGDMVRHLNDGNIEFIGRVDQQVKVRGFRVELDEIGAVLSQHPALREAVVVAFKNGSGHRLAGYVVALPDQTVTVRELREYLNERLPDYMAPSWFVFLDEFPLTQGGKINRKLLPEPEQSAGSSENVSDRPCTFIEDVLIGLWMEVLGVERIGIRNDFFELGGHSLLATQLVSRIRNAFSVELPVRAVFEAPGLAEMAERIDELARGTVRPAISRVQAVNRSGALPLSYAQQRLWFIEQMNPGRSVYNVPAGVRVKGELDVEALERTIVEVARRHEALRTRFRVE